ncbi:MAG: lysophospholipid acyltransferase family protein [Silicimonas sp.]|nr:lysophospholipid acyltransferase family protein [Silicimonas sp.]
MGKKKAGDGATDKLVNLAARALLGLALLLPYKLRVPLVGWATTTFVAPLAGWRRRIRNNLAHALPDLPKGDVERIVRNVSNNVGRTLIEIYSGEDFIARIMDSPIEGPGVAPLEDARAKGRPMVLVTAHLGNYDVVRGKLSRTGYPMGALYRPMGNTAFNAHYLNAIATIAEPVFPTDARGISGLVRMLKDGGVIGIVADVGSRKAPLLQFFDRPAHTPVSAAEWALKYDAVMIPIFGLRQPDGLSFRIHVADPIPPDTPEAMMQRYNDTVEQIVRQDPDQWFWIHKRWKRA